MQFDRFITELVSARRLRGTYSKYRHAFMLAAAALDALYRHYGVQRRFQVSELSKVCSLHNWRLNSGLNSQRA
jgi:hypothetical protein